MKIFHNFRKEKFSRERRGREGEEESKEEKIRTGRGREEAGKHNQELGGDRMCAALAGQALGLRLPYL